MSSIKSNDINYSIQKMVIKDNSAFKFRNSKGENTYWDESRLSISWRGLQ